MRDALSFDVDLVGAAAMLHRRYDWMRGNWRRLVADEGFPAPFVGAQPGGRPWWRASAIEAWKDQKSGLPSALNQAPSPSLPPVANDALPRPRDPRGRAAKLLAASGSAS